MNFILQIQNWLKGKKVYLTAIGGIIAILIAWSQGTMGPMEALQALWVAIIAMAGRAAIVKSGPSS